MYLLEREHDGVPLYAEDPLHNHITTWILSSKLLPSWGKSVLETERLQIVDCRQKGATEMAERKTALL